MPEKRRSIRDIPIPEGRRSTYTPTPPPSFSPPTPQRDYRPPATVPNNLDTYSENKKPPRVARKGVWVASVLALLVLAFALISLFNSSTLSYIPKSTPLLFDRDMYTAEKTGDGKLFYNIIKLSKDKGMDVVASGDKQVSRKASGTIVVYNNASVETQRLVENTRFETPDGLVYRIQSAIVIPGKKTISGLVQPGSIEATVYADQAGEKYNTGLSDFTLPGLAGTNRFTTIYARSKTTMSGGFVGMEKSVSAADETETKSALEVALRNELMSEARAQVPEDFILIPSLSSMTFEDLPQTNSSTEGNATLNMRSNLVGVMFKKGDLSTYMAIKKTQIAKDELVDIVGLDSLTFSYVNGAPTDLSSTEKIDFSVTGDAVAVWRIDEVALRADLLGKNKRDIPTILNNYPNIVSATATIRPFWKSTFPYSVDNISIKQMSVK